ncbi:MAG: DUF1080 domain-containing protein [Candidatus Latescibacteria bacterium]|nr:DUF1080 domain-containing protein [Candidatus Latescibacterota bacterium]
MKRIICMSFLLSFIVTYTFSGCGENDTGRQPRNSQPQISQAKPSGSQAEDWITLFDGANFDAWQMDKLNGWVSENGAMALKAGGSIWTKERFGNFTLSLDFKVSPDCNSGVFFRTGSLEDPVQTGIEMQVFDSVDKTNPDKHDCGALYDLQEPSTNAEKNVGEWNNVIITCNDNLITIVMNDTKIIDIDVNTWISPNKNPDGTDNKFNTALKDFPREGYIGFQDHGHPVWYRNVKLKKM